ncbi:MAG: recombinase family protein [Calditrichia bacterium]
MSGINLGYKRVSTVTQKTIRQLEGIELDKIFVDTCSGSVFERENLENLMDFARIGDTVWIHSIDRLARNLGDLLNIVKTLNKKGVRVIFIKENLIFETENSPISKLMLSMIGAFAEFERTIIRERQQEGIEVAKKQGKYKGRKKTLDNNDVTKIKKLLQEGATKAEIARNFGVTRSTLYRYLKGDV